MTSIKVAIAQVNATSVKSENIETAKRLIIQAAQEGCSLVALPEVFTYRGSREKLLKNADRLDGSTTQLLQELAKQHNIAILGGSICEQAQHENKVYNTSIFIDETGQLLGYYRKIHLFDADVESSQIRESDMYLAGKTPTIIEWNGLKIGLSICYDLRFPELYRFYAKEGVQIFTVPSSFTTPTGKAHWEVLLRARAIENHAFVIAPNQVGVGAGDVATYGNSMIIDPWGHILARASQIEVELITAELDRDELERIRSIFKNYKQRFV